MFLFCGISAVGVSRCSGVVVGEVGEVAVSGLIVGQKQEKWKIFQRMLLVLQLDPFVLDNCT